MFNWIKNIWSSLKRSAAEAEIERQSQLRQHREWVEEQCKMPCPNCGRRPNRGCTCRGPFWDGPIGF